MTHLSLATLSFEDVGLFSCVLLIEETGLEVQVEGIFHCVCPCFGDTFYFIYLIF